MKVILCIFYFSLLFNTFAQEVRFSAEDRDRILKSEIRLEEFKSQSTLQYEGIQKQFENIQLQLNNQQTFLYWGFGILISMMGLLLGFVIWDRRTIMSPVRKEAETVKTETQRLISVLKTFAEQQSVLKEIMKNSGFL